MDMDLEQKAIMRLREAADTSERFYKAPLLLLHSQGARRSRPLHNDGRSLG